jgi:hypothetical protein
MKTIRYFFVFSFLVFFMLPGRSQVLNVVAVEQEQDQWCWAGVSGCVLQYYCTPISQCNIAEYTRTVATWHNFGTTNCCVNASLGCNYWNYNWGYPGSIQDILIHFASIQNPGVGSFLSQANVTNQVTNNCPFVIRWGWTTGGGHFLVGHGLIETTMYYMDPWFGEGLKIADYDWVVSGDDHTWTHTNKVTTPSPRPYPAGTVSGPTTLNQGQTNVAYSVPAITNATSYIWTITPSNAGTFSSNSANTNLNLNASFNGNAVIQVNGQSACGAGAISSGFNIVVNPCSAPVQPGAISGPNPVCEGATTTYSISPVAGATSYTWTLPIGWSGSSSSTSINVTTTATSGIISVTANNDCGAGPAQTANILITPSLPVSVEVTASSNPVCTGTTVTFTAVFTNGGISPSYQWTKNGTIVGTNSTYSCIPFDGDVVICILTSSSNCVLGNPAVSDAVTMIVSAVPSTPAITGNGNVLSSNIAEGNQWYLNDTAILGANNQAYTALESGEYWDVVTINGCSSSESNHITITLGIEDLRTLRFTIYPIPNDGHFTVSINSPSQESYTISVYNNIGMKIYEVPNFVVIGSITKIIDCKPVSNGIYSVILNNGKSRIEKRILVNK